MHEIREDIDRQRRHLDNLIVKATARCNTYGKAYQWKENDALLKSLELLGTASHYLWLSMLAIE